MELQEIQSKITIIRGQKVILDRDLAILYGVETKVLKQAVRRNIRRFPDDFMFEMTKKEFKIWRSQIVTSKSDMKGLRYAPFCFTEQGIAMLSSVLNSDTAIEINIAIMRAFVLLRQHLTDNKELKEQIKQLEQDMNVKFEDVYHALDYLVQKSVDKANQKNRNRIGFKTDK